MGDSLDVLAGYAALFDGHGLCVETHQTESSGHNNVVAFEIGGIDCFLVAQIGIGNVAQTRRVSVGIDKRDVALLTADEEIIGVGVIFHVGYLAAREIVDEVAVFLAVEAVETSGRKIVDGAVIGNLDLVGLSGI